MLETVVACGCCLYFYLHTHTLSLPLTCSPVLFVTGFRRYTPASRFFCALSLFASVALPVSDLDSAYYPLDLGLVGLGTLPLLLLLVLLKWWILSSWHEFFSLSSQHVRESRSAASLACIVSLRTDLSRRILSHIHFHTTHIHSQ